MIKNQLRIIGGKWRGRKISLASQLPALRPTHDRVRETLFNWLMPYILDSHCADLFAGSGALGFEALSRGASHVYFVDHEPKIIQEIKKNADRLNTLIQTTMINLSIPEQAITVPHPLDIVFLDPPYRLGLILPVLNWLLSQQILHQSSLIYFETEKEYILELPNSYSLFRYQTTASLQYGLLIKK